MDPVADRLVNWLPFVLEHLNYFINKFHSSVVDLGPRVFMSCPLQLPANEIESWFINLWNHFVIPYLMGAVLAGIEVCTSNYIIDLHYCLRADRTIYTYACVCFLGRF